MKRYRPLATFAVPAMVATIFLASSCQQFFTSSLGEFAARDSYDLSGITQDQAIDLAAQAMDNRDTDLAGELLPEMAGFVADHPNDAALVASATQVAGLATGIDDAVMGALADIGLDALMDDPAANAGVIASYLDGVTVNADALAIFTALEAADPAGLAAAGIGAGDYVNAALALVVSELGSAANVEAALATGTYPGGTPAFQALPNVTLAADLIASALLVWPDDDILSGLSELFADVL
ncbi:MAG: hypothetical protein NT080_01675 [Spirochaetes bacterium]|nr:hypothetical protein [Spirochaetota bacterium]